MTGSATPAVTFRPRRLRRVCWVLAPVVVIFFAIIGTALHGSTGDGPGVFEQSDQYAMIGLGVLVALGILIFTRPKVTADANQVIVRNVIGGYTIPWSLVASIRFDRGSPWASLELVDDDLIAVMAVQAADKELAVTGVRALRKLLLDYQSVHGQSVHGQSVHGVPASVEPAPQTAPDGASDLDAATTPAPGAPPTP